MRTKDCPKLIAKFATLICVSLVQAGLCSAASAGVQRWTYCMVNKHGGSEVWISSVYRQDFGYDYDPQVYGRLVNRFYGAVQEQFGVNADSLDTAFCYMPTSDLTQDEVDARRASEMRNYQKTHHVVWP